jgi:hypothetical protein
LKLSRLSAADQRLIALAEESILADRSRTHARRSLRDGTTVDLTAYDDFNVVLTFHDPAGRGIEFIDFVIYKDD